MVEHGERGYLVKTPIKLWLVILAMVLPLPAKACSVAIVFAIDISRSVSPAEYVYQKNGLARALISPEVQKLMSFYPDGIMATVTVWSGADQQKQMVPWSLLHGPASVVDFAQQVADMRRPYRFDLTAIANALIHAGRMHVENPVTCNRLVIDISGDGVTSVIGQHSRSVAEGLADNGVTINALVIAGSKPDPVRYYAEQVIRGTGAFMIVADGFQDFEESMHRKLMRELAPAVATLRLGDL